MRGKEKHLLALLTLLVPLSWPSRPLFRRHSLAFGALGFVVRHEPPLKVLQQLRSWCDENRTDARFKYYTIDNG